MIIDYHIAFNRLKFAEKSGSTPFTSTVFMAVRIDQPELASIMEKGLSVIKSNDKEILEKWIVPDNKNYEYIVLVLGLFSIFFIFGLVRFFRLKIAIKKIRLNLNNKFGIKQILTILRSYPIDICSITD